MFRIGKPGDVEIATTGTCVFGVQECQLLRQVGIPRFL
jgi:hypothetical protein